MHNQKNLITNISLNKFGFTIIELIVVITILAILGTIGFVSFSSHLVGVRDTSRQEQLGSIYQGLESYKTKNILPLPDDYVEVRASGSVVGYQGYAGKNILSTIGYSKGGQDPKDEQYYSYYISKDKKHIQLMGFLEDAGNKQFAIIPNTYAVDYTKRYPTMFGKSLGILTESGTNTPIQEVSSIVGSGYLDVVLPTTKTYVANFTDQDTIVGTGVKLVEKVVSITIPKSYKTCKEIYDNKPITNGIDGVYTIKNNGYDLRVYCDMTTSSGGWTLVSFNKTNSTPVFDKDFMVKNVNIDRIYDKDTTSYLASLNPEDFSTTNNTKDAMLKSSVYSANPIIDLGTGNWDYDNTDCVGLGHTSRTAGCSAANSWNDTYINNDRFNIAVYLTNTAIVPYYTSLCQSSSTNCNFEFYLR